MGPPNLTPYRLFQDQHPFYSPSSDLPPENPPLPFYIKASNNGLSTPTIPNAALIIDGAVMRKMMNKFKRVDGDFLSMKEIVDTMEELYVMKFIHRHWYQGTKDGKWNSVGAHACLFFEHTVFLVVCFFANRFPFHPHPSLRIDSHNSSIRPSAMPTEAASGHTSLLESTHVYA